MTTEEAFRESSTRRRSSEPDCLAAAMTWDPISVVVERQGAASREPAHVSRAAPALAWLVNRLIGALIETAADHDAIRAARRFTLSIARICIDAPR